MNIYSDCGLFFLYDDRNATTICWKNEGNKMNEIGKSAYLKKMLRALTKNSVLKRIAMNCFFPRLSDVSFLKLKFRLSMGYPLNLKNPVTYNEKLQWMKLFYRHPSHTMMVDKYAVRSHVAEKIGEEHLIPLLGVWDHEDDIDFDSLPQQFVLKCTHNSALGLHICKDKSMLNTDKVKKELRRGLDQDFYRQGREWPYKNVKRRIIAEQFMVDSSGTELKDYKFFCFDGKARALFVASDRNRPGVEVKFDFFDMDWNRLPFTNGHPNSTKTLEKPACFDEMVRIAELLSQGLPHVRVDLYDIMGQVFFGELTFFHHSGIVPFVPADWDRVFGDWLTLPRVKL